MRKKIFPNDYFLENEDDRNKAMGSINSLLEKADKVIEI